MRCQLVRRMLHFCCLTSRYLHPLTQRPEGWRAALCAARRSSGKWPTPSDSTTSRISPGCSRGVLVAALARTRQKQNSLSDSQDCSNAATQPSATLRDESSGRSFTQVLLQGLVILERFLSPFPRVR